MLLSFSVVEIMISLVHFALIPVSSGFRLTDLCAKLPFRITMLRSIPQAIHLTEFGYIYWGYRVLDLPTDQGVLASECTFRAYKLIRKKTASQACFDEMTLLFRSDLGPSLLPDVRTHRLSLRLPIRATVQV